MSELVEEALAMKMQIAFWKGYRHAVDEQAEKVAAMGAVGESLLQQSKKRLASLGKPVSGPGPDSRKDEP